MECGPKNLETCVTSFIKFFFNVGPLSCDLFDLLHRIYIIFWQQVVVIIFLTFLVPEFLARSTISMLCKLRLLAITVFLLPTPMAQVLFKVQTIFAKCREFCKFWDAQKLIWLSQDSNCGPTGCSESALSIIPQLCSLFWSFFFFLSSFLSFLYLFVLYFVSIVNLSTIFSFLHICFFVLDLFVTLFCFVTFFFSLQTDRWFEWSNAR